MLFFFVVNSCYLLFRSCYYSYIIVVLVLFVDNVYLCYLNINVNVHRICLVMLTFMLKPS